ncbi:glycerophosphoryl diester phosphodiesterase [Arcanobacterium sp. S3PF19]|uniref:glycerophosphoryl diester phosphodiesterase n=1 Tax=Arcanobacterium sp. S3PF19 TaxID=1219585 RepID=UPI00050FB53E|nr:glycerophosphoryl diester phosphodiesterase [Arcanobacterium sp. S3PF19]KGF05521.1 glycerophosphodiester phosphodiesterase [Arcanobacterium sp. S3PF19]
MADCTLMAHRGLNTLAPENTFSAFRAALDNGINWIETDVDALGDGTPIIIHDTALDRTTNRFGSYYDLNASDLPQLDAGSWFSPKFAGEPVPTLRGLIRFMNEKELNANIEIKSNEQGKKETLRLIDNIISELEELSPSRKVIVSSFNHVLLHIFKQRAPKLPVGCLYETAALYDDWKSVLELVGADYIHPEDDFLTAWRVEKIHRAGFGINAWTVDSPGRANQLANWGVDGIISNVPHIMKGISGAKSAK